MLKLASRPVPCRPLGLVKAPLSPDRRVTKKYRRAYIRKLKEREYRRLRAVVPALAHKEKVNKVTVIEEAIKYIDELHQALVERIQTENDYPIDPSAVTSMAQQVFTRSKSLTTCPTPPVLCESNRTLHINRGPRLPQNTDNS